MTNNKGLIVINSPKTPYDQRVQDMLAQFQLIMNSMAELSHVIPHYWVHDRLAMDVNFSHFANDINDINIAMTVYNKALQKDPDLLPDDGDREELKSCFRGVRNMIKDLELLLPDHNASGSFVGRIQNTGSEGSKKPIQGDDDSDGAPTTEYPENKAKFKKKDKDYYTLPGMYKRKIKLLIKALQEYAGYAAPLVGVVYNIPHFSDEPRPEQPIGELREYSIQRTSANPVDYGVSAEWVKKLNLTLTQIFDSPAEEAARTSR